MKDLLVLLLTALALHSHAAVMKPETELIHWDIEPGLTPAIGTTRLCTSYRIPDGENYYILDINGMSRYENHVAAYRCKEPFSHEKVWNCAEPVGWECEDQLAGIWSWQQGQPHADVELPPGVGIEVGADSGYPWIVIPIHYRDVEQLAKDPTKLTFTLAKKQEAGRVRRMMPFTMRVYGEVPAHSTRCLENSFLVTNDVIGHPFSYMLHTHMPHSSSQIFLVAPDGTKTLMGREDEVVSMNRTATTHPVLDPERMIRKGDRISMFCRIVNDMHEPLLVRSTGDESEMCVGYFMYYPDTDEHLPETFVYKSADLSEPGKSLVCNDSDSGDHSDPSPPA